MSASSSLGLSPPTMLKYPYHCHGQIGFLNNIIKNRQLYWITFYFAICRVFIFSEFVCRVCCLSFILKFERLANVCFRFAPPDFNIHDFVKHQSYKFVTICAILFFDEKPNFASQVSIYFTFFDEIFFLNLHGIFVFFFNLIAKLNRLLLRNSNFSLIISYFLNSYLKGLF